MSYKIEFNESKKQVFIETPKILIDSAALVIPKRFKKPDGTEQGEPQYSIRGLMKVDLAKEFKKDIVEACAKLLNGKTQIHPDLAPKGTDSEYLIHDFFKTGSKIIAKKKENDLHLKKGQKKSYHEGLDYLDGLYYFFARSKWINLFDKYGEKIEPEKDEFFMPSFIGRVQIIVKRNEIMGSQTPVFGGNLTAYLQSVQYIQKTDINFMGNQVSFEKADDSDNMFGVEQKENDIGFSASSKKETHGQQKHKIKDDVDDYIEDFEAA